MAVPKHKASKARTRRRRTINMRLQPPHPVECNNCGNLTLLHKICPKCGFYRGKQILKPEDMA